MYQSTFATDPSVESRLRGAGVIGDRETVSKMVSRVVDTLAEADGHFAGITGSAAFAERLGWQMDAGRLAFSTPVMAHAGRLPDRPLAACAAPAVDHPGDLAALRATLHRHVGLGLSTGLSFDDVDDPLALLHYLNHLAVLGAADNGSLAGGAGTLPPAGTARPDRTRIATPPVEHAALLSLSHPLAERFVAAKVGAGAEGETWRVGVTLMVADRDMRAALTDDGRERALLLTAAAAARAGSDPGLLFVDRLHAANPAPDVGVYVATSPAGEVGLVAGETCTFGHVNLARFHRPEPAGLVPIDLGSLADSVYTLVRALDDAVEASALHQPTPLSAEVADTTRKVGVGVCGLADLLHTAGVDYASPEGRHLAQEVLGYVNYVAKLASVDLAVTRGPCPAVAGGRSRYASPRFLGRFANADLRSVSPQDWAALAERIALSGMLRNTSVTALAATPASAPVLGASDGIEPLEAVDPADHLAMAAAAQSCVDEGVATTLRLPGGATAADIYDLFVAAWELGCKTVRTSVVRP